MFFDFYLFRLFNNFAGKSLILDWLGIFSSQYLIFLIAIFAVWAVARSVPKSLNFLRVLLALVFSYGFKMLINLFYFRPRPFASLEVNQLIDKISSASFPSGHATIAFSLAFSVYFLDKKLGSLLLFLAALVAISRVYTGVHYPVDILAGAFIGFLSALMTKYLKPKRYATEKM